MSKKDDARKDVDQALKADPELAAVFKKINELGKGTLSKPKAVPSAPQSQPPKLYTPQVIRERKDPKLIREDPIPKPASERPEPRAIGDAPGPAPTGQVTAPQPAPAQPDAQLIQLVRLYQQLSERDKRELFLIAMMKAQLSKGP